MRCLESRHAAPLVGLALLVGLAAPLSAGTGTRAAGTAPYRPSAARVPACARVTHAIALPPGFPGLFPLPPHTAVTAWQRRAGGVAVGGVAPAHGGYAVLVEGIVPARDVASAARSLLDASPRAGFATIEAEVEPPSDAEGVYRGHGYLGRWLVHSLVDCPGAVILSILAERS